MAIVGSAYQKHLFLAVLNLSSGLNSGENKGVEVLY